MDKPILRDSSLIRWTALVLISMVMFSSYYFYDVFSGIKAALQAETGISNAEYGQMYGAYSFTNSVLLMTFIGGMILDRWGIRRTGITFLAFITLGTITTAYGASSNFHASAPGFHFLSSFWITYSPALKMMILGRLIFGLGAETFYVVINKIIARWFKGKELALAFGISLSFGRFGTMAAMVFSPMIAHEPPHSNITPAAWFGVMLAIIGVIAFIVFYFFESKLEKQIRETETKEILEKFRLADLLALLKNKSFLYISLLCITFYSAVFPFIGFLPDFLHNKFGFSLESSGQIATILPFGTVVFTPLFGLWCDFKGKSASIMILGSLLLLIVHFTFALTTFVPYIPLFFLGVAFSLVPAAMWPSVAKIVEENRLGTAYGLMFTIQNYGLMLFPAILGKVLDLTNKNVKIGNVLDYKWAILMLGLLGIAGLIFALLLRREDKTSGYGLELPNRVKKLN
jgi:MFS family permease